MASRVCRVERTRWPVSAALERHLRGIAVADLAGENHVGVLPQSIFQAVGEGVHVAADLALRDQRDRRLGKKILHGLLDGDDAIAPLLIQLVDEHRQAGRLARADHAADQHQSVAIVGKLLGEVLGKAGPLEVGDDGGNEAETGPHLLAAEKVVDTESLRPAANRQFQREIDVVGGAEAAQRVSRAEPRQQVAEGVGSQLRRVQLPQSAVNPQRRRIARHEVKVGSLGLDGQPEPVANFVGTRLVDLVCGCHATSFASVELMTERVLYAPREAISAAASLSPSERSQGLPGIRDAW